MTKTFTAATLAAMLLAPGAAGAVDAIYGVWGRDGHARDKLEFYDCAGKLCAKGIIPQPDGSPPVQILRSAAKTGSNSWEGPLFNPEDGKTYKATITLESASKLTLKGCLVAFLCQSEGWTKISGPAKPAKPGADAKPSHDAKPGKTKADSAPEPASAEPPAKAEE